MVYDIIATILLIMLVVLLINPHILKFLKRPTRWKAFGIWLLIFYITFLIYESTPTGKADFEQYHKNRPLYIETYSSPPPKIYPVWDIFMMYPIEDTVKQK